MQRNRHSETSLGTSVVIIGSLFVSLFLAFSWGNSLLKHAVLERQITDFEKDIEVLEGENKNLEQQLVYLRSPQYRDKWAKEHEGLMQPGEKVVYIEPHPVQDSLETAPNKNILEREILLRRPKRDQWKWFFFGETSPALLMEKSIDNETEKDGNSGE